MSTVAERYAEFRKTVVIPEEVMPGLHFVRERRTPIRMRGEKQAGRTGYRRGEMKRRAKGTEN